MFATLLEIFEQDVVATEPCMEDCECSTHMRGLCAVCGTDWFRFTPSGDVIECGFCKAPHRP